MRQFQLVPTTYVFSINEFFTISFFKQILNHFHLLKEISNFVEINKFSHIVCHVP